MPVTVKLKLVTVWSSRTVRLQAIFYTNENVCIWIYRNVFYECESKSYYVRYRNVWYPVTSANNFRSVFMLDI